VILGIGIDSVEIARVAEKCRNIDSRFIDKMYTDTERGRAMRNRVDPYQHLAACFAAREAFFKATQVWYRREQVSVAQHPTGQPYYVLSERISNELGPRRVHLSLTHDQTHATAFCICEE
jgi:holo-[acyl-carrier protein] synthase